MTDSAENPFDQFVPKADSNPFTQFTRPMPSGTPPAPPVTRPQGVLSTIGDLSKSAEGAAITGTGQTIGGLGGLLTRGAGAIDSALGTNITPAKPIWSGAAKSVEDYGQGVSDSVSPEFKEATSKGITDDGGLTVTNVANKAINTIAGLAPQIVGTTAAGLVNPAAGVATGAALFGGQGGQAAQEEEQQRVAAMSDADLANVPRYKELLDSGLSASDAKAKLSDEAGSHAFNVGAGTGAALGVVPLAKATDLVAAPLARAASAVLRRPGLGAVVGRGLAEGGTFGGINAAGQVVQNETNVLPTDATEGVGEAAASGLLPGFVMGAAHQIIHRPGAAPVADQDATASNTTATPDTSGATPDVSTATPDVAATAPATAPPPGPISRAASMVSPEDTATLQARQQPDAPIENAEADAGAPLTSQEPPAQPPDVPWIDASTGEIRRPTDAEVKDEFHDMFDNAIAANGGAGAAQTTRASPALAQEWGVPLDRLKALRTEAVVERRSGFRPGDKRPSDFNEPGATDGNDQTQTGSEESTGTQAADAGNGATTDAAAGDAANAATAAADGTSNESAAGADAHGSPAEEVAQSQASDRTPLEQFSDRAAQIDDLNAKRKAGELTGAENEQLHDLRDQQDLVNPKSGIPNRKAFDQAMSTGDYSHAVAMDVDGFKRINDTLGHGVGDLVLQHLGQRLAKESNGDILFTHNSGDEYAAAAKADPTEHLQKLQDDLAKTPIVLKYVDGDGKQVEHTLSGLGLTFGVGKDLHEADIAANTSKEQRADAGLRTRREDSRSNVAGGLQDAQRREAAVSGDRRQERVPGNAGDAGSASDNGVTTDAGSGAATATAGNRKAGSERANRLARDDGGGEAGIAPNPDADLGDANGNVRKGRKPAKAAAATADHSGDVADERSGGDAIYVRKAGDANAGTDNATPPRSRRDDGGSLLQRAGNAGGEAGGKAAETADNHSATNSTVKTSVGDVKVDRTHDVPLLGSSSKDGTVYIDKDWNPIIKSGPLKGLDRTPMLVEHEAVEARKEKEGLDYSKSHYDHAEPAEHKVLLDKLGLKAGTPKADKAIEAYEKSYKSDLVDAAQKKETNPPPDLIEKPYEHPHNVEQRRLLAEVEKAPGNATPEAKAELDAKSIADLHDKNHEAAYPGGSPEVKRHMVERVAHAIAGARSQDLIDMNIGDPKNAAVRQTFEQSTGVKLPKGRQATENRVEKWGDDHYAAAKEKEVADAARESAAHPDAEKPATAAQQEAGNHKMGHVDIHGLDVTIEVPKGGLRRGIDKDFKEWERPVSDHYGYIKRTEGADGEQVDVYLGPHAHDPDSKVFVIEQNRPGTNRFDEHKAMIGYATGRDARKSYEANFPKDFKTFRNIREMSMDQFKQWVKDGGAKNPFGNPLKSKDDIRRMANGDPSKPATQAAARLLDNERARQAGTARDLPPPGEGSDNQSAEHHNEISAAVNDAVKKFGDNAPNVRVVDSPEKLPAVARRQKGYEKARGYYDDNGNAYLVSPNIKDTAQALRSLTHEVIGHHGIENILDEHVPGGWDRLAGDIEALRTNPKADPAIASVLRDVERRYKDVSKTQFAKETLAVMAERNMRNGIIGRVIAAVKAFIRKFNPDLKFSDADLRSMLAKSEDFINKNEIYADRVERMEAGAFDQPDQAGLDDKELSDRAVTADAAKQWQEKGPDSPYFQKWFGDSKVVDKAGGADVVYHGTGADFNIFDSKQAGASGEHATAPLGHFFTENRALADRYADRASEGVPADKRVVDAYLSIKNPYELKLADAQKIETPAEARALRTQLEKQGYDGIRIPEAKSWVAFDSEQIKSASENRGTFDAKNKDISFDRAQPDDDGPHEDFSKPKSSVDSLNKVLAEPDGTVLQHVRDWIGGKIDDLKPKLLGALQLRHVLEMMEGYKPLKGAGEYKELEQTMTADRMKLMIGDPDAAKEDPKNMIAKGPANIAAEMRNYAYEKGPAGWFGRQRPEAKALYDVMHSATRFGLDPAEGYSRLQMEDSKGGFSEWSKEGVAERIKELRGQMRGRPGDDKSLMMDEVKRLRNLPKREELRKDRWPELVAKWQALPEEGKELYRNVRDWYRQNSDEVEKALLQRIDAMDVPETYKRSIADRIRFQFESNRREGVYFPLQRHGDYWMSLKDSKGENAFLMFEGSKEYAAAEKKLRAGGYTIEAHGRKDSNYKAKDAPSGTFVSDVIKMLQKSGAPEKVQDDIYQSYLKTLPELSMRKHSIHRQNIAGFSEDALRVFAKNSFHSAHQLARLRYGYRMQGVVDAMQMSLDNYRAPSDLETRNQTDPKVVARADTLLGELKRRHDWIMAPKDSNLANVANSMGFIYYLGASPSSALVFLTQNAQMTLPALGAKHGWAKAAPALMSAMKDAIRTGGNIDRTLTSDEERQVYNVFKQRGDITRTQAHALAGLSEGNKLQSTPAWAAVMNSMSFFMHKADMINRGAAGMAAFRLARKAGEDFDSAVSYASDIINGTHGDYSNANRARFMQGSAGKVLFQFKSYALMMAWNTYRNLYQSFKAETPEARKLARKTFTGMMGMAGLLSGAMGLPFYGLARSVGNAYHSAMGDQNEPWDFDTEFKNWLSEHLGSTAGSIVAHGAADKLGADVSSRVGLSDEWFREPDKELEGMDEYYNLLDSIAGPLGGITKNFLVGKKMIEDGNAERGMETIMPKPVRDIMKSYRYSTQGANTVRGDPIVQDVTTPETLIQALGFAPTRIAEQQAENRALQNYSQQIQNKRQQLVNGFAIALRTGDEDLRSNVIQRMQAFNATNPEIAISAANLRSNWLSRQKASAETVNGVHLNKKVNEAVRTAVGA